MQTKAKSSVTARSLLLLASLCLPVLTLAAPAWSMENYELGDGEPVRASGAFKGCSSFEDGGICDVEGSDGQAYSVIIDGQTPADAIDALRSAGDNDNVTIEGLVIAHGDVSLNISAETVTVEKLAPGSDAQSTNALNGLWRSDDDARSTLRFDFPNYYDYYDGDAVDSGTVALATSCADSASDQPADLLVKTGEDGTQYCYSIENITKTTLSLMYLPRGNMLTYTLVDPAEEYQAQ